MKKAKLTLETGKTFLNEVYKAEKEVKNATAENAMKIVAENHNKFMHQFKDLDKLYQAGANIAYENATENAQIRLDQSKNAKELDGADLTGLDQDFIKEPFEGYFLYVKSTIKENISK